MRERGGLEVQMGDELRTLIKELKSNKEEGIIIIDNKPSGMLKSLDTLEEGAISRWAKVCMPFN